MFLVKSFVFKIQSINGTVMKSCQSTCTSNSYTLCCNTANCNTQMPISCYTGSIQSFSSSYCDFLSTSCQVQNITFILNIFFTLKLTRLKYQMEC